MSSDARALTCGVLVKESCRAWPSTQGKCTWHCQGQRPRPGASQGKRQGLPRGLQPELHVHPWRRRVSDGYSPFDLSKYYLVGCLRRRGRTTHSRAHMGKGKFWKGVFSKVLRGTSVLVSSVRSAPGLQPLREAAGLARVSLLCRQGVLHFKGCCQALKKACEKDSLTRSLTTP